MGDLRAAAAALLAAAAIATPTTAYADAHIADVRPCATPHEIWTTPGGLSRADLEHRWEVTGKGYAAVVPWFGNAWVYPLCDELGGARVAVADFTPGRGLTAAGTFDAGKEEGRRG